MNDDILKLLDELGVPVYSHDEPARLKPTDERILDALLRYEALRGVALNLICAKCNKKIIDTVGRAAVSPNV
jgi:hypothetical protein